MKNLLNTLIALLMAISAAYGIYIYNYKKAETENQWRFNNPSIRITTCTNNFGEESHHTISVPNTQGYNPTEADEIFEQYSQEFCYSIKDQL